MSAIRLPLLTTTVACTMLLAAPATAQSSPPDSVSGLTAWYDLESVHRRSRDGDTVDRWEDSSGNGHDLSGRPAHDPPVFNTKVLNGRPVVTLARENQFDVTEPFELTDHTIFLVFATDVTKRALFSSETDPKLGIVLRDDGRFHYLKNSKNGDFRYNRSAPVSDSFGIVVLGREAGSLHAFINGHDLSSGLQVATSLRVARLFQIEHTPYVSWDGAGLRLAEMVFYHRYLPVEERRAITRYLSEKFGLDVQFAENARAKEQRDEFVIDESAVQFRASMRANVNVNDELVALAWDLPGRVDGPFRLDVDGGSTRLHCTRDGTSLRASVRLPLRTKVPDARVRLLFLINDERYHPRDAISRSFAGQTEEKASVVELQVELQMNDGDFFEVITTRDAADGVVRVPSGEALFTVERIE